MATIPDSQGNVTMGKLVCEVKQVFIHIPAEQSAAGFELKIAGLVRIVTKPSGEAVLSWDPEELSYHDVSSLYSSETEGGWTLVEEEVIVKQPRSLYPTLPMDDVDPIVNKSKPARPPPPQGSGAAMKKQSSPPSKPAPPPHVSPDSRIMFPLSNLKYIKEGMTKRGGVTSLTFNLLKGNQPPPLHFHDGGTSNLIQSLKRYVYLVRDGKDNRCLKVEESPFIVKADHMTSGQVTSGQVITSPSENRRGSDHKKIDTISGPGGILGTAVLDIGRRVRHGLLPTSHKDMLEERPRLSEDNEDDEIQTITCQEVKTGKGKGHTPDPDMSLITDYQIITHLSNQLPERPPCVPRAEPLSREEWESYRELDGSITAEKEKAFRARVFAGSIDPSLRREVWKYLLGYFKFESTDIERMEDQKTKADQYEIMKKQWQSFLPEQEKHWSKWREVNHLVDKDVIRTDRELDMYHSLTSPSLIQLQNILNTYIMYNFDLGYVQGMSDILAPILAVMDNECDAFWCFVGLMEMIGHYFEESQTEMRMRIKRLRALLNVLDPDLYQFLKKKDSGNLYFSFRWLLIDFKREFIYDDLMCIWEVLWTRHLSNDYALFIALAIIDQEKEKLQNEEFEFSDIIAHINNLSKNLEYGPILMKAESICRQVGGIQNIPQELQLLINQ